MKQKTNSTSVLSAMVPIWLLMILVGLAGVSMVYPDTDSPLHTAYATLQRFPWQSQAHINLAADYIAAGNETAAREELLLARVQPDWPFMPPILGQATDIETIEKEITQTSEDLRKREEYWKSIAEKHPSYKDAWIQLAYIASLQKQTETAIGYTQKIQELDPNFGVQVLRLNEE